jgi:DNA-binding beta-propeller fold protein YncE
MSALSSRAMLWLAVAAFGSPIALYGNTAQAADDPAYVLLQGDHAVSVRNSRTLAPITMIATDGQSIDSRLTPDGTKLYVLNVGSPKMTVIRAKCPANKVDWSDAERATGKCVPNSKLEPVTIPNAGGFYFSIRRDSKIIYVSSSSPDPAAPKGGNPFTSSLSFIYAIDIRTDRILRKIPTPKGRMSIAGEISPDGKTLWIATADGFAQGLNPETGAPTTPAIFVGLVPATAKISPDGRWLFAANMPPGPGMPGPQPAKSDKPPVATVGVVDLTTLKLVKSVTMTPNSMISGIEVVGKKHQVWLANANNTVVVVDMRTHEIVKTITVPYTTAEAVDVSPDGERALVVSFNGKLMDPSGQPQAKSPTYIQLYSTTTFEPIGAAVFVGNNSGGIPSLSAE